MNALEQRVLELVGESPDSPDVFTDDDAGLAPIRDSLSDAIAEIVMMTGGFKRQYFLPLRAGMLGYRVKLKNGALGWITDVWSVNQQRRLEQTDLIRLSNYNPRWMTATGSPESYLLIGKDIVGFYPKPSGDSDVLELTVVEIPATYKASEDRIKLKDSFKYAAVHYAVSEFWASRGDAGEAETHMQMYLDAIGMKQIMLPTMGATRFETSKEPWPKATA